MKLPALPRYVRAAPRIFYGIGVLDFVRNLVPIYVIYEQQLTSNAYAMQMPDTRPELFHQFLGAVVYAAGWFAYGVFALILLSIHDRVSAAGLPQQEAAE